MKILALLFLACGILGLWVAFRIQFLRRLSAGLKVNSGLTEANARYGALAIYFLACSISLFYFAYLLDRAHLHEPDFFIMPCVCAVLVFGRHLAFSPAKKAD